MLFKSDPLPINSCARVRENLHIVIAGNSNLLAREAHSNPCAFSCGVTKMSHSQAGTIYYSHLLPVCSPASANGMWVAFPALLGGSSGRTCRADSGHPDCAWLSICWGVDVTQGWEHTDRVVGAQWWHPAGGQHDGKRGTLSALWLPQRCKTRWLQSSNPLLTNTGPSASQGTILPACF